MCSRRPHLSGEEMDLERLSAAFSTCLCFVLPREAWAPTSVHTAGAGLLATLLPGRLASSPSSIPGSSSHCSSRSPHPAECPPHHCSLTKGSPSHVLHKAFSDHSGEQQPSPPKPLGRSPLMLPLPCCSAPRLFMLRRPQAY